MGTLSGGGIELLNTSAMYVDYNLTETNPVATDNDDNHQHLLDVTRLVIHRIVAPTTAIFGIINNIINIVVLTRRWMRSSTNYYLTVLAVFDTLYLVFAFCLFLRTYKPVVDNSIYWRFVGVGRPCSNVFSNTSTWLTVTFTVERYIGVCHPLRGRSLCTTQRAKWIIGGVCCLAFMCTLPDFFEYRVDENYDTNSNITTHTLAVTSFGNVLSRIGYFWINSALFTFIPFLLLAVFNSLLIHSVMQASKLRKTMANIDVTTSDTRRDRQQQEQQKITIMLISIVVVFFMCQLPSACMLLVKSYDRSSNRALTIREKNQRYIAGNYFNLLIQCNAAVNFILYSFFSTKFRKTFKRIFCSCMADAHSAEGLFSEVATVNPSNTRSGRPSLCIQFNNVKTIKESSPQQNHRVTKNGYLQIQQHSGKQEDSV